MRAPHHGHRRIVLTGGGTGGHVTPHLALLPQLLARGYDVHFIGTGKGMERELMSCPQVTYHVVSSGKLRRYFDWRNFTDPFRVLAGIVQSAALIRVLRPDVCFSKGGFVSVPVVIGSWMLRVPVLCHESDLTPGLANRICACFSRRVATSFPDCARMLGKKGVHTGTPLRPDLFSGNRKRGLSLAGFDGSKPVLLMMGGSQGAKSVNAALRGALDAITQDMDVLHLCGEGNLDASLSGRQGYFQAEFLRGSLPDALACADLVLSRAGSNALSEFEALRIPMLLVPLPHSASRGDQIENAERFRQRGLAHVLPQEELNPQTLAAAIRKLWAQLDEARSALNANAAADGTAAVLSLIEEVQKQAKKLRQ